MNRPVPVLAAPILVLALALLSACAPAPHSDASQAPAPQAAAQPTVAAPPAPVRHATMICRNSQDGRKVACGTPNAVMVGIKED